jgi:hypothetical protein
MKQTRGTMALHCKLRSSPQMHHIVRNVEARQSSKSEMVNIIATWCQIYV